jgi:uncharacterized protein (UPF0332 family)
MPMVFNDLEQQRLIQPYRARPQEIQNLLRLADRDLATAQRNLPDDPDWAYGIAYNAVLQAARALMFAQGFRPRGADQHHTVVRFVERFLGAAHAQDVALFDRMRQRRHQAIYDLPGTISAHEATQMLAFARRFVATLREHATGQPPLPAQVA